MRLRVVTWNIHKGIGTDRRYSIERTIDVLASLEADVLCLQEVDEHVPRSRFDRQAHVLARELGFDHLAVGLNVRVKGGHYGNATLSRFALSEERNVDLTIPPKKRRGGLVTRVAGPSGHPWTVANIHLGLLHLERRIQVRNLVRHLLEATGDRDALVVAGDTNDWGNRLRRPLAFHGELLAATLPGHRRAGPKTFPSRRPIAALDKILVRPPVEVLHVETVLDDRTRAASDHLPLVADLRWAIRSHPVHESGHAHGHAHAHGARG
jgi:endonuclease/exonuclease/phosphatase family metal-dependent hydrolase